MNAKSRPNSSDGVIPARTSVIVPPVAGKSYQPDNPTRVGTTA